MDNPYKEAQLRGWVIEQRPDPDFAMIDRISRKYTGKPFPFREKPTERLVLIIAVERLRATSSCRSSTHRHSASRTFTH